MVYDVSNLSEPSFVQYLNTSPDDISTEGLLFIKKKTAPMADPFWWSHMK